MVVAIRRANPLVPDLDGNVAAITSNAAAVMEMRIMGWMWVSVGLKANHPASRRHRGRALIAARLVRASARAGPLADNLLTHLRAAKITI